MIIAWATKAKGWFYRGLGQVWTARSAAQAEAVPPKFTGTFDVSYAIEDRFDIGDWYSGRPAGRAVTIDTRIYFVADIKRFECISSKDGSPWSITGATLKLVRPNADGTTTVLSKTAAQLNPTTWYYDSIAGDLSIAGTWRRYWVLADGSVSDSFGEYIFTVRAVD